MTHQYDLTVTSCIHHVPLSKRISSLIAPMIDSVWEFLPWWEMSSLTLEFEKDLYHFEYPIELMDQEDRVMEHNTRRVMKHIRILQGAMSPMHRRKGCLRNWEVFILPTTSISSFIRSQCIVHHFLCPLHKYRDEISYKGEGCHTPSYIFP
jgi:hypothetical protein